MPTRHFSSMFRSLTRRTALVFTVVAASTLVPNGPIQAQDAAIVEGSGKWTATFVGRMGAEILVEKTNKDSESRASFSVRNAGINKQVSWDIAEGVCGDNAQSIVARAKFRMIQTGNDGSGTARATIPRLDSNKRYYARVFEPGDQFDDRSMQCVNMSEQP